MARGGEKSLPIINTQAPIASNPRRQWQGRAKGAHFIVLLAVLLVVIYNRLLTSEEVHSSKNAQRLVSPAQLAAVQARCASLSRTPQSTPSTSRTVSDRHVEGTKPLLIKNATIWTGRLDGEEVIYGGDVLIKLGVIRAVGRLDDTTIQSVLKTDAFDSIDAKGAWVTPGLVDLHSHLAVNSSPSLRGANDGNSRHGITQPWLRSLDGLNTHDDAYALSMSGGVTSSIVLPGSANAIGGQGFAIKLRPTAERSPTSMLLDPPANIFINTSSPYEVDWNEPPKWRQMKHACGENPSRVYGNTRMDNIWSFRSAYETAHQLKQKQDAFCDRIMGTDELSADVEFTFPEDLQWEALVDVLRGRVKVHVHCYEAVDLDDVVRLTNEFRFPIAAFHHAHETYLVPNLLKKAFGLPPASAIFATNARYKREAFRGSEFAARILAQNGLKVIMKSDHPVLNSRYLLYEAQQAFYYGLPANLALAAVTTTPAEVMGASHRIGSISEGLDGDVVIWDSHPLALGATPKQVYIDGIPQIHSATRHGSFGTSGIKATGLDDANAPPFVVPKPEAFQVEPKTPNFDREASDAIKWNGLPPIAPAAFPDKEKLTVFFNVSSVNLRRKPEIGAAFKTFATGAGYVVVRGGTIGCVDTEHVCQQYMNELLGELGQSTGDVSFVDLKGGSVSKGLVTYGSPMGMEEIQGEISTSDGVVWDAVLQGATLPDVIAKSVIKAVDGLSFATRHAYTGYRAGVTIAVSAPKHRGFLAGVGTAFSLSAPHRLAKGAVLNGASGLHISIGHYGSGIPSVSTQIGALRRLLLETHNNSDDNVVLAWFTRVSEGKATLIVEAQNSDIIASLVKLKEDVEKQTGNHMKMTITGASEAHLLAKELGEAGVGIIVVPSRPFPTEWESRRILPGPPLTRESAISVLLKHNVKVGIGIEEPWSARNTRFDAAWAALEAPEGITKSEALALVTSNLEQLLGLEDSSYGRINLDDHGELVVTELGDLLDFESKVVGVISQQRGLVDIF